MNIDTSRPPETATDVALVTGAAAGIGRSVALRLARRGVAVAACDIDGDRGAAVVELINQSGARARFFDVDLRSVVSIRETVERVLGEFGRIDLLANNAGVTRKQGLFEITEDDWEYLHSVNSRGAFFAMQAVAQHMAGRRRGRIVNVASIAALGYRGTTSIAYSASKSAVLTMTRVGAHLLAPHDITVNAVCPGPTYTEFVVQDERASAGKAELSERQRSKLFQSMDDYVPIGRANSPDDVAGVVDFLLSDAARNVSGSAYTVDGGIMLY